MEDLIEDVFYEERVDSDNSSSEETEAALYSWVHHSEDTYGSAEVSEGNYNISRRNKADRWDQMKKAVKASVSRDYKRTDYMPKYNHSQHYSSKPTFNARGKPYSNYGKPWEANGSQCSNVYEGRELFYENSERVNYSAQDSCLNYHPSGPGNHHLEGNKTFDRGRSNCVSSLRKIPADSSTGAPSYLESVLSAGNTQPWSTQSIPKGKTNTFSVTSNNSPNKKNERLNTEQLNTNQKEINTGKNHVTRNRHLGKLHKKRRQTGHGRIIEIVDIDVSQGEVINISDSDRGSECGSIEEVGLPPKPNPPVVALDSSDEAEVQEKNMQLEPVLNVIPSVCPEKEINEVAAKAPGSQSVVNDVLIQNMDPKKKKRRKKIHEAATCEKWTLGMRDFYNDSWGGESFNHIEIQRKMPGSPSKWRILNIDRYGSMSRPNQFKGRCSNCNQFGHHAYYCPDPPKIPVCIMCGARGHTEVKCPNKICLKCGQPARLYVVGCPKCWDKSHPVKCNTCGDKEHFEWQCPDAWRKFHSVTSIEAASSTDLQATQYKAPGKLACCFCTERGHTVTCCPKQTPSGSRKYQAQMAQCERANTKKRKRSKTTSFEGRNRNNFSKKRRTMH